MQNKTSSLLLLSMALIGCKDKSGRLVSINIQAAEVPK